MRADEIAQLYDRSYAASYDRKFLSGFPRGADADHEVQLIGSLLDPGARWLDVACGTGYFLSRFSESERAGLDISPAMLELARERNPGVDLRRHDFLEPLPEWNDRFDLVSCMWYAYCLVDSVDEVSQVVANLAAWTSPGGACFLPVADPDLITGRQLPDRLPQGPTSESPGEMRITGIVWSFFEEPDKAHRHMVSPSVAWMQEEFRRHFETVETVHYPPVDEFIGRRPALVASRKLRHPA